MIGSILPEYGFRPLRLWRLWDVLKLDTSIVTNSFSYLGGFVKHLHYGRTEVVRSGHQGMIIEEAQYAPAVLAAQRLWNLAVQLEMTAASASGKRAYDKLMNSYRRTCLYDSETASAMADAVSQFIISFSDELEARIVVEISPKYRNHFEPTVSLFGDAVDRRFPGTCEDIGEAAKCLALERYTSTVFHLMRAMEQAVQALSARLQIANVDREWGKLLSDINKKIEEMPKGSDRNKWSESHTHLYHVKQAWRNETMHPKQTYTEDEAKAIFDAVRVFMADLATLV